MHNAKCAITPKGTKAIAKNDNGDYIAPLDKSQTPIHIVDLPNSDAATFVGKAVSVKLEVGMTIYRVTTPGRGGGRYWTLEPPISQSKWRKDYAVFPDWNQGTTMYKYTIKDGDNVGGWLGPDGDSTVFHVDPNTGLMVMNKSDGTLFVVGN